MVMVMPDDLKRGGVAVVKETIIRVRRNQARSALSGTNIASDVLYGSLVIHFLQFCIVCAHDRAVFCGL